MTFGNAWQIFYSKIYDWTFVLNIIFVCLSLSLLELKLHKDWKHHLILFAKFVLLFGLMTLLSSLFFATGSALNFKHIPLLLNFSEALIVALYFFVLYKDKNYTNRSIKFIVFLATTIVAKEISKDLGYVAGQLSHDNTAWVIAARSIPLILIFPMTFLMNFFDISKFEKVSKSVLSISLIISFLMIGLTSLQNVYITNSLEIMIYVLFLFTYVALLAILCLCYYSLYHIVDSESKALDYEIAATLTEAEKKSFQLSQQSFEEISKLRHDLKNHFSYLHALLEENKVDEAVKYIESYSETNRAILSSFKCPNDTIRVILEMEMIKAKMAEIQLNLDVLVPKDLAVKKTHLVSILTNLIDNAIENHADKTRPIDISIKIYRDYLRVTIVNAIDPESVSEVKKLKTKKTAGHGYGMKIIDNIAKEYKGYALFNAEGDSFISDVILSLIGEKNAQSCDFR